MIVYTLCVLISYSLYYKIKKINTLILSTCNINYEFTIHFILTISPTPTSKLQSKLVFDPHFSNRIPTCD